ncbi:MAG TPA: type II toxin-antitoxin system HicB family antitoxin [Candidatus Baltobacterales bacterium]|nr:type II toxin-antitoxin system HicB family antitoxin [Candidatus Baltobacterales bacterium]
MKRKTYTAQCERAGDWWAISVPELRGVHTQARRLEKAEGVARDAIAIFLDVPIDSFEVRIEPRLPRDLEKRVGRVRKVREDAEALQREAAAVSAEVASDLVTKAHMTVRDAGRVLGLSHQRIAQLIKPADANGRHAPSRRAIRGRETLK